MKADMWGFLVFKLTAEFWGFNGIINRGHFEVELCDVGSSDVIV